MGEGQQDLRGGERADAGLGGDQARGEVFDEGGNLPLQVSGGFREQEDALAQARQGLMQDPGLPVSPAQAGQVRAFADPPVAGQAAEPAVVTEVPRPFDP